MKVKEEFYFEEVEEYLEKNVTLVIANPSLEERKNCIYQKYLNTKNVMSIVYKDGYFIITNPSDRTPLTRQAPHNRLGSVLLSFPGIKIESILVDITSLQHVAIACLLRAILCEIKPARLFLTYVKPEEYIRDCGEYEFSQDIYSPSALPGYASHAKNNEMLVPFLGFEGIRLKNIIGDDHYSDINPIIGFPSDNPIWQFETLKNCKDSIVEQHAQSKIRKCKADSIYGAYTELEVVASDYGKPLVIAPLGTRPHFVAAILYGLKHKHECRIIYDNASEKSVLTRGIRNIKVYHISRFIGEDC
ncbi:hypothetical protein SAMN02910301_0411 [Lachnospiraceae bacterium XBD2001]|nr:hypothetical protein SAMN02910301_0411 [Lachnospiraceae bacterium XBD2001]